MNGRNPSPLLFFVFTKRAGVIKGKPWPYYPEFIILFLYIFVLVFILSLCITTANYLTTLLFL